MIKANIHGNNRECLINPDHVSIVYIYDGYLGLLMNYDSKEPEGCNPYTIDINKTDEILKQLEMSSLCTHQS